MSFVCKKSTIQSSYSCGLQGTICIPGDRSLSHFSIILGGIAAGETQIRGVLESDDVLNTMRMMHYLGARFTKKDREWIVQGVGNGCLLSPEYPLDFKGFDMGYGLMMGVVGVYDFQTFFKGRAEILQPTLESLLAPLYQMGVQVKLPEDKRLPLVLHGPRTPNPIVYKSPMDSVQSKSVVLLAGLNTPGITEVIEPVKTQDHMEIILKEFGVDLLIKSDTIEDYSVRIEGRKRISGCNLKIPGDSSIAFFPLAAALLIPGSDIKLLNVLTNPLRVGIIDILREMGADITLSNSRIESGENIADIRVRFSKIKGITISDNRLRSIVDEYPILLVISAFAEGETIIKGLAEVMTSKQFSGIIECFNINNIQYEREGDYLMIKGVPGGKGLGCSTGHMVQSKFGYRVAMSFLVMGLASEYSVVVDDYTMISTIFPDFINLMKTLVARIVWVD
ncbi:3-phosphoshikimate 1-carboxyvinyltransferase [Candidatus Liberibacter asiaticus]